MKIFTLDPGLFPPFPIIDQNDYSKWSKGHAQIFTSIFSSSSVFWCLFNWCNCPVVIDCSTQSCTKIYIDSSRGLTINHLNELGI